MFRPKHLRHLIRFEAPQDQEGAAGGGGVEQEGDAQEEDDESSQQGSAQPSYVTAERFDQAMDEIRGLLGNKQPSGEQPPKKEPQEKPTPKLPDGMTPEVFDQLVDRAVEKRLGNLVERQTATESILTDAAINTEVGGLPQLLPGQGKAIHEEAQLLLRTGAAQNAAQAVKKAAAIHGVALPKPQQESEAQGQRRGSRGKTKALTPQERAVAEQEARDDEVLKKHGF